MNTQPLISVIVPVYNVAQYLPRCLDSICNQSYQNLEIILVDDGSADNSLEICQEYAAKDKRIRVFHQENKGVSAARNLGLRKSAGGFITFVDADDWVAPHYVQCLVELSQEYDADITIGGCLMIPQSTTTTVFPSGPYQSGRITPEEAFLAPPHKTSINIAAKLYRKSILAGLFFDTTCSLGEDTLFFFHALQKASCVASTNQKLYVYYRRSKSAMDLSHVQTAYSDFKLWENIVQQSQNSCAKNVQKAIEETMISVALPLAFYLLTEPHKKEYVSLIQQLSAFFRKQGRAVWQCQKIEFPGKLFIKGFLLSPALLSFFCHIPPIKKLAIVRLNRETKPSLRL